MSSLILHYAPDNASLIIRLALEHLEQPFETVLVDRFKSAQKAPEYLAVNPNGPIPTLITPDGPIFETTAILLWLDARYGGLLPVDGAERAMALKWLVWLGNTLHPDLRMMFYPHKYTDGDQEALRASARRRITRHLQVLSDARDAPWLNGQPSAMGFYLGPMLRWATLYGGPPWFDLAAFPRLMHFAKALERTPAMACAVIAEGLGPHPISAPIPPDPPEGSAL